MKHSITLFFITACLFLIIGCENEPQQKKGNSSANSISSENHISFKKIPASQSKINFSNTIKENKRVHYFIWNFIYQGAGVAIGDINNDGLQDIYLSGNMVSDKLYLNKGNFEFEDISAKAGIEDKLWSTGVTMVDVNADGLLDIYVCKNFFLLQESVRKNKLFINNGDLTFSQKADEYGLADPGYAVQSNFFDADNDGDLDMYLVNQPMDQYASLLAKKETLVKLPFTDKFFRNDNGKFTDITEESRLKNRTYGLNALVSDFTGNGWSDFYVCNDYNRGDQFMINNGQLKFSNEIRSRINHTSFYSMGADAADINNDGWIDFLTLDMAFGDHYRSKTNMESMRPDLFWKLVEDGNHYQYAVNNLQLNQGYGFFSEIAHLSGISHTDWSWSPLFIDLDDDGLKDLLISNGLLKDLRNNDFLNSVRSGGTVKLNELSFEQINAMAPSTPVSNYAYRNKGQLKFEDVSSSTGFNEKGFSTGMAYGDLDNDGDMDVVVNNSNALASVFENTNSSGNNYLNVKLSGKYYNKNGLGAKVKIFYDDQIQAADMVTVRGYMSSSQDMLHFGLGKCSTVDSVIVIWDHLSRSKIKNPAINKVLTIDYESTKEKSSEALESKSLNTNSKLLAFTHKENSFDDYKSQVLLPHKLSQNGPYISKADINNDGLDDLFIGGAKGQRASTFIQKADGQFEEDMVGLINDENLQSVFTDFDGDGNLDLLISNGGHENDKNTLTYFKNENGKLSLNEENKVNIGDGQVMLSEDFNGDGTPDIFVGGRSIPNSYPKPADSYLFINENGVLKDRTEEFASEFKSLGLVTDAITDDIDNDGDQDLIIVGEWMPITVFKNEGGKFRKQEINMFNHNSHAWWWSIEKGDFDNDGDTDFLLGNLGLNNKFHASPKKPFQIYADDFDGNGDHDVVLAKMINDKTFPVRGKECSTEEMPFISEQFKNFDAFAKASLVDIFSESKLNAATSYNIKSFSSLYLENTGSENFKSHVLPIETQFGPIKDFQVLDFNNDGNLDFIFAGNHYPVEVETVRYDANKGGVCLGNGKGEFSFLPPIESGIYLDGDIRDLEILIVKNKRYLLATVNDGELISIPLKN